MVSCGQVKPEVFIVPLGTGNDLARVLGLGKGYSGDVHVRELLDMMKTARIVQLDRYVITGQTLTLKHVTPSVNKLPFFFFFYGMHQQKHHT